MKIIGTIMEIGQIEGHLGEHGIVVKSGNSFISVAGMTEEQTKECAPLFMSEVSITIEGLK